MLRPDRWKAIKHPIEDHWIRRIGPVHFEHVNFKGTITFEIDSYADALIQRQPKLRARRV